MATELSFDLVEEILSRVPARSLARLRCTCKHLKTLIEDPRFVSKHFSRMRCREQQFTVMYNVSGSTLCCVGIDFNEFNVPSLNLQVSKPWDLSVTSMAHCDGLLLYVMFTQLLVLNPLLKQARWVNCVDGFNHSADVYGLGYISDESLSPRYKMVSFRCGLRPIRRSKVEVYEFESDSWKVLVDGPYDWFYGSPLSSVCLRGTPYWIGRIFSGDKSFSIQSFNFSEEIFKPLLLPPSSILREDSVSLGIFGGDQLSLLHKHNCTNEIDIWVMKQLWSKLMTVKISGCCMDSSYLIEKNGKVALFGRHFETGSFSIYIVGGNGECQKVKHDFPVDRMFGSCYYVPSLLQVPGFPQ